MIDTNPQTQEAHRIPKRINTRKVYIYVNHIKNAEDQRQILEKNQRGRIAIPITKQG